MFTFENVRLYHFLRYGIKNRMDMFSIYDFHEVNLFYHHVF